MPSYDLYVRAKHRRVKYPRRLNLQSVQAAHGAALTLAKIFLEGRSSWRDLGITACDDFTIEAVDGDGLTVLSVPARWMWAYLVQAHVA